MTFCYCRYICGYFLWTAELQTIVGKDLYLVSLSKTKIFDLFLHTAITDSLAKVSDLWHYPRKTDHRYELCPACISSNRLKTDMYTLIP